MTNIKSKVIIGLVIFAIIIIGLQISFHLRIKDVKIFEMKANITDKGTGFNNNESVLDFGIVPKLSNSIKFIDISQTILDEAKVKIKLSVSGVSYKKLKALLLAIEENLRLMDVVDVNFSSERKTADLEIDTYYYKIN